MVRRNYKAWQIDPREFSDHWHDKRKLAFFARYAVLAPSGHNTQPWELTLKRDALHVKIHGSRRLSIDGSGLLSVEPYISIGTFLEVFQLAGKGFGYEIAIELLPSKQEAARLRISGRTTANPALLKAITQRVSNRHSYERQEIDPNLLQSITTHDLLHVSATSVSTRDDIEFVGEQTEVAIKSIMGNPEYRRELSQWVRTNFTRKFEGMPGFTHGFGHVKSLASKMAVRHAPKHGPQAQHSRTLISESGALVIVRCDQDDPETFMNAGRLYSRICVLAKTHGYATSALGASVLDARTRELVCKRFGISDRPLYIIRVGTAMTAARHSPRWPVERVLSVVDD